MGTRPETTALRAQGRRRAPAAPVKPSIPRDGSQSKGAPCASSGFFLPQLLLELTLPTAPVDPTRPVRCRSFFLLIWTLASERAGETRGGLFQPHRPHLWYSDPKPEKRST